jgi:hypothetical protein
LSNFKTLKVVEMASSQVVSNNNVPAPEMIDVMEGCRGFVRKNIEYPLSEDPYQCG